MANRYSKSNTSSKAAEEKNMQSYEESRNRLRVGARIMVIIVALAMVVTMFLGSGVFFLD